MTGPGRVTGPASLTSSPLRRLLCVTYTRPLSASLATLSVVAALHILSACAAGDDAARSTTELEPGWQVVARTDTVRTSIDTTRLTRTERGTRVWISITSTQGEASEGAPRQRQRFDTHQEIDCANRQARALAIRIADSTGRLVVTPVADSVWLPFATGRLAPEFLEAACQGLGTR